MTLNIVRLGGGNTWKVLSLPETDYRETPKQFRFRPVDRFFNHVDKDLENTFGNNQGYAFSRELGVEELKIGFIDYRLHRVQKEIDRAEKSKKFYLDLKSELKY